MPETIPGDEPFKNAVRQYRAYHKASYSFEQVVADLIDNSVDAGANAVEILIQDQDLDPSPKEHKYLDGGDKLYCIVLDDGKGIPEEDMHAILSRGFEREYDEVELGSYGVGLKDSSLSQAYEVTLFSRTGPDSEVAVRRLSSCLVKRHKSERIFRKEHLDPWMSKTEGYELARELVAELEHGTAVLLEGMHKLELKVGDGDRKPYLNAIEDRVRNYISLVFQYYMDGVDVPRLDGTTTHKQVDIYYGGRQPYNKLAPLDPFYREPEFRDGTRTGTTCVSTEFSTSVDGSAQALKMRVTAWLLPHRRTKAGVKEREDALKKTKEGRLESNGTVGGVGILDLQGAYIYRNMRLVQFAPDRDPWLGMMTKDSHHNSLRVEVHLPPGQAIGSDRSDFDINTSKSSVGIAYTLLEQLRVWAKDPKAKFHPADPGVLSLQQRVILRNGQDKWPTCSFCGSEDHKKTNCPERPRCPQCNSLKHTAIRDCPRRPACAVCGTRDHITEDHTAPEADDPGGNQAGHRGQQPLNPGLFGDAGNRPGTNPDSGATNGLPNGDPRTLSVRRAGSGPVIATQLLEGELVVDVNVANPLYADLRREILALDEADA